LQKGWTPYRLPQVTGLTPPTTYRLAHPDQCLLRGDEWIFGPEAPYECAGDVGHVAFPCGSTVGADGDTLHIYYGAADTSIARATASIRELLGWLDARGTPES
jgi:predicted GH43/DUF377 family glycosyl hydrolase